ncbi:MAG: GNAT family N-acetyltransferase [Flavobacteriales bacterium]|nr:GNAT family N-acetyltransferase [Flavobacteriales bacterium]
MITATTVRLVLRDLEERDAEHILALNSDPEVLKHVHDVPFSGIDAARSWIAGIQVELPLGIGRWAIESKDGTWIGRCSLRRQPDEEVLMGFRLLREHWGQGYASEVVGALLKQAFDVHRLPYVASRVARENLASRRVLEKNGGRLWKEDRAKDPVKALVYRFEPG